MSSKLTGRVALVTGGTRGIGLAIANLFAAEGAHVFITGRNAGTGGQDEWGEGVTAIEGDVTRPADLGSIYARIASESGRLGAAVQRYLVVGGAGSLETAPGRREMDDPRFPAAVRPEAQAGSEFLNRLRASDLDWTFLSPSRFFEPGVRTGKFRIGQDRLLVDAAGRSAVSMEDYAIAMVDELERPAHSRQRFTVGY
jgi:NAD(P)-dependent dehydrogenase (short-subunit alcohol dehydrogenase family)